MGRRELRISCGVWPYWGEGWWQQRTEAEWRAFPLKMMMDVYTGTVKGWGFVT